MKHLFFGNIGESPYITRAVYVNFKDVYKEEPGDPEKTTTIIEVMTGKEWHSSYWCKGQVFEVIGDAEEFLFRAREAVSQEWIDIMRGKHGKWVRSQYSLLNGTILKAFAQGGDKHGTTEIATDYFMVDLSQPERIFNPPMDCWYNDRRTYVKGQIRKIPMEEFENWGIVVPSQYLKYVGKFIEG